MSNTCRRCFSDRWEWSNKAKTFCCAVCHTEKDRFYQKWEFDQDRSLLKVSKCVGCDGTGEFAPVEIPYLSYQLCREINSITRLVFELAPRPSQFHLGAYFQNNQLLIDGTEIFTDILEGRISHDFGGMHSIRLTLQIALCNLFINLPPYSPIAISCHPASSRSQPRDRPPRFEHSTSGMVAVHDRSPPPSPGEEQAQYRRREMGAFSGDRWYGSISLSRIREDRPSSSGKPKACVGCTNYHGRSYGGNRLICGIHPYGYDGDRCPDHSESDESSVETPATMPIDAEVIRQRLGLEHFHEFAIGRDGDRQSGRTTRMICEALAAVQNGERVLIVAHSEAMAGYIKQKVVEYAIRLELNRSKLYVSSDADLLRSSEHRVFRDHVVEGQL